MELNQLAAELEEAGSTNLEAPPEMKAYIRAKTRERLLLEFHELKLAAQLNRKVGDEQRAASMFEDAKKLLKMIEALDSGELD
jgi:hypothetical protein